MPEARIGIIGGSGLYELTDLRVVTEVKPQTPFGEPSAPITVGDLQGVSVAFLPRHGVGHRLNPSEVPSRANIYALKTLGVERIISVSAVGSLREELHPLDLVVPDQLLDRTRGRPSTFFQDGIVAHIAFADPFCPQLSQLLAAAAQGTGASVHRGGTYIVIEGPAFSTRAESNLYRSWGASVIGMTALPEAKLAREAEICYTTLACVTDYDTWHPHHGDVTAEMILSYLSKNVATSRAVLESLIPRVPRERACSCGEALRSAFATARPFIPEETTDRLRPIIGRYLGVRA
ncbi:MAG: S-methyl-5'-thioadenosine phosphorylase [Chloroflexi bacterium]|nr:S-methyl-5'-thioadenosine phosphorylase [Chloroflexota bacterium]